MNNKVYVHNITYTEHHKQLLKYVWIQIYESHDNISPNKPYLTLELYTYNGIKLKNNEYMTCRTATPFQRLISCQVIVLLNSCFKDIINCIRTNPSH